MCRPGLRVMFVGDNSVTGSVESEVSLLTTVVQTAGSYFVTWEKQLTPHSVGD